MRRNGLFGTAVICVAAVTALASAPVAAAPSPDQLFSAIADGEYAWRKAQMGPSEDGPKSERFKLPDVGAKVQAERLTRWAEVSRQLATIPVAKLSHVNQVNYAVYKGQIDALLAEQRYREYEKPLNADSSFWGDVAETARDSFQTEADYRAYIAMLRDIPRYYDQQIVNMRAGLKRGFTPPQITLRGRDAGVALVAEAATPQDSPFYAPFKKALPAVIPAETQAALRREAAEAITQAVVPAHARLRAFLRDEYIPGARRELAAYALPDGQAYYRSKVAEFTTTDMTPEQIHQIGLAEVAKIRARMLDVMKETKFEGDLPAFLTFLRTDPRFYAKTPQDLLDRAAWNAKRFDGVASQWFGRLPRSRFAIRPVPDEVAPFYTGGRGGPGIYLVNTYNLPSRPLYSQMALTLHESAPGHAFQMPLAAENTGLPAYRRDTYLSAYGEGWALYSEALGEDMGLYDTPYDRFGMLSYQMWRAARLVVDTGLHTKGWTREQAQQYLHDNTAMADHEIQTEVDRYIAWPGQALSYYMGMLAFVNARQRAEKALGPKFNIRAFHDAVLELGSVPLPVIDARVDQLIAAGGKGPYSDVE
ncbi:MULTISPECIES: DUF885 family protein [unclassified Caulobacter]|uniref:DUF885 domain-containing protein n=1 Tax=unclassified Caulobacter TaxID=2648921 RepID=UPI000782080D|nr:MULTISPECIES: DUF885 family protein [unclassified Caulobacter]AZS20018.1 DUF885 family protein [Caulobacter sp. FWC26]